jgi:hypothetical protein
MICTMRRIERASQFKKDYKRESTGRHRRDLDADLQAVLARLLIDELLPEKHVGVVFRASASLPVTVRIDLRH